MKDKEKNPLFNKDIIESKEELPVKEAKLINFSEILLPVIRGTRKSCVASLRYEKSKTNYIYVNNKLIRDYFNNYEYLIAYEPIRRCDLFSTFKGVFKIKIHGGGKSCQAQACAYVLARFIAKNPVGNVMKENKSFADILNEVNLLFHDTRKVFPKTTGRKKNRKIKTTPVR